MVRINKKRAKQAKQEGKQAKQEGKQLKTDVSNMSPFVHIATDKLIVLLQQQRPPRCRCVKVDSELLIDQEASQGASSRFRVQCMNCKEYYIYSTGSQWLELPTATTFRPYIKRVVNEDADEEEDDDDEEGADEEDDNHEEGEANEEDEGPHDIEEDDGAEDEDQEGGEEDAEGDDQEGEEVVEGGEVGNVDIQGLEGTVSCNIIDCSIIISCVLCGLRYEYEQYSAAQ